MVKPLEYHLGLSLEAAEERYREVRDKFEKVQSRYSGLLRIFKRNLREDDNKTLVDCIRVLLPLGLEASVQDQVRQKQNIEDTLYYQIEQLHYQIINYLAGFRNTGVTKLYKEV
jgi:hypothetical protein